MDPTALANLLAQLIPLGIQTYEQLVQANATAGQTTAQMLAKANADWQSVITEAQSQLGSQTGE
jgi:hypothetical protein